MVNDGIGNGNFTTLKPFAFWTQHVLPLVYGDEISYMETLGKMRDILNELIKNNNNLPTYIQQMIEEYISSGAIESVIDKILSNFILNVKYPPTGVPKAKGDGTTNDHDSIQGCIDYAATNGGGIVYLPAGKYLTSPLVLKPGVTLLGFGRYATSLILAGGATTHLITGTVSDAGLLNLTLNAKMSSQVNRVDAVELIGNHIDIRNCIVKDCYTSINVQKTGGAINICDVICEVASDACLRVGGTDGGLLVDGLEMTGLSTNLGVAYIVTDSNGDIYRNINIHGTGAIGIDVAGSGNYFDGIITGVTKDYEDSVGNNIYSLFGKTRVENLTGEVVESANAFSQKAVNGIDRQGANISDNSVNTHTINAKDIVLNPTNPLTYKTPTSTKPFSGIPFKDYNSVAYNVLVGEPETLNHAIEGKIFNTVSDLIKANVKVGDYVKTMGYTNPGDYGGSIYQIINSGTPDGGSVIQLNNGLFASALFESGVTPQNFGIVSDTSNNDGKWDNYVKYVNGSDHYFRLPVGVYYLTKGIIINKSVVGDPLANELGVRIIMDNRNGAKPFKESGVTANGYSYVKTGAICIDGDVPSLACPIEIKNLYIQCNYDDSLTGVCSDYGIYIPDKSKVSIENIRVNHPGRWGIIALRAWSISVKKVNVFMTRFGGFDFGKADLEGEPGGYGTLINVVECYAQNMVGTTNGFGFVLNSEEYSSLINCACDQYNCGTSGAAYAILNSRGINMLSCGTEAGEFYSWMNISNVKGFNMAGCSVYTSKIKLCMIYISTEGNGCINIQFPVGTDLTWGGNADTANAIYIPDGTNGLIEVVTDTYPKMGELMSVATIYSVSVKVDEKTFTNWRRFENGTWKNVQLAQ